LEFLGAQTRLADRGDLLLEVLAAARDDDEPTSATEDEISHIAWDEYKQGEYISAAEAKEQLLREKPPGRAKRSD